VGDLEALEAVARFGLLADYIKDRVDEFGAFGVVALGPVVTSACLPEDEVVRAEKLTKRASANRVHGARLEVHEYSTGDVAAASGFVEVDVDAFELKVGITMVGTSGVDAVLIRDYFPELSADLVTALAALDVYEFTHCVCVLGRRS
jgi:proteasome assembly chaperone (PAC2) family protein